MKIEGYKAFNKEMKNRYGTSFKENTSYHIDGDIKFGVNGNGLHFCKRLEDTLRYVDGMNEEIVIAKVIGSGEIKEYYDDYNGYYDLYAASDLYIESIVPRNTIVNLFLNTDILRTKRFLEGYKLTKEELTFYKARFYKDDMVIKTIEYYQEGDKDAFTKVKRYGE